MNDCSNSSSTIFHFISEPTSHLKFSKTKLEKFKQYKNNNDKKNVILSVSNLMKKFYEENKDNYSISLNDLFRVILPDENYTFLTYENYLRLYYQSYFSTNIINKKNNKPLML